MTPRCICAFVLLLSLMITPLGLAQDDADDSFADLQERFNRVTTSVLNQRSVTDADKKVLERVREQMQAYAADHPDDVRPHAAINVLSDWLDDDAAADAAFTQMVRLSPTNADLVNSLAGKLKAKSQYQEAIAMIERSEVVPEETPSIALTLASLLYAENEFEDAIELLESVDLEQEGMQEIFRTRITNAIRQYTETLDLWTIEQELREAEASTDDLPRVELMTTDGPVVIELFENETPNTVANFISHVEAGDYNDRPITNVRPDGMTEVGERPDISEESDAGDGASTDDATTDAEEAQPIADENTGDDARLHFAGSVAMALPSGPNSARTAFYMAHTPMTWMNGRQTVFGRVLSGLDVVRQLSEEDDQIVSARVLRKRDHDYTVEYYDPAVAEAEAEPAAPVIDPATQPIPIGDGVTDIDTETGLPQDEDG